MDPWPVHFQAKVLQASRGEGELSPKLAKSCGWIINVDAVLLMESWWGMNGWIIPQGSDSF